MRALYAICFFCFAIGLVMAPVFGSALRSAQAQDMLSFLQWTGILSVLLVSLCFAVKRFLGRLSREALAFSES